MEESCNIYFAVGRRAPAASLHNGPFRFGWRPVGTTDWHALGVGGRGLPPYSVGWQVGSVGGRGLPPYKPNELEIRLWRRYVEAAALPLSGLDDEQPIWLTRMFL